MKRLYEEYLHIPEEGKIKEKVFIMRIVVAIVCMVCCLSAMGFSAYAYFTSSITSGSNTIVAATYSVDAAITTSSGTSVTANTDEPLVYDVVGAGTYNVSLTATGTATTGYCKIEITGSEKTLTLFTQQMAPEENMSFSLVLNGGASITVTPQWGTYSNRSVVVGDKSTQEIQLVTEAEKDVTTPNTLGVSQTPNANEAISAGSQPENQTNEEDSSEDSLKSEEGTEKLDGSDATNGENIR